jgi:hypothetical protein
MERVERVIDYGSRVYGLSTGGGSGKIACSAEFMVERVGAIRKRFVPFYAVRENEITNKHM